MPVRNRGVTRLHLVEVEPGTQRSAPVKLKGQPVGLAIAIDKSFEFNLIEVGAFGKNDSDTKEDFIGVYEFHDAFVKPFLPDPKNQT